MEQNTTEDTSVLYNGECPVCRFEIDHYAEYSRDNGLPIRFDDLNSDALAGWGVSADDAAKRLHVRKNGQVYSGIPAFVLLWQDMALTVLIYLAIRWLVTR